MSIQLYKFFLLLSLFGIVAALVGAGNDHPTEIVNGLRWALLMLAIAAAFGVSNRQDAQ